MASFVVPQRGGKLIGKGAYGCIFNPPLECFRGVKRPNKYRPSTNKLGKITDIIDIKNEISAAKFFKNVPSALKYCILPQLDSLCKPLPLDKQTEAGISQCDAIEKYGMDDMMQYELEYGGKTLKSRLQAADVSIGTFPFFKIMGSLLEIGAFLTLHGFIHNDLHTNNVVLEDNYEPRLIDFGRSYSISSLNTELLDEISSVFYNPEIAVVPPEITLHHGLMNDVTLNNILDDLLHKKSGILNGERILGMNRKQQIKELREFFLSSRSAQSNNWLTFYKTYWPRVDSWAIGSDILTILRRLLISRQFTESNEWKQKQSVVKEVLRGLIQASPKKRIDCVEALALYDPMNELVTSVSGRGWLEKVGEITI